jgi:hypothetical protein
LVVIFLIKKEEERRGIGVESSSHVWKKLQLDLPWRTDNRLFIFLVDDFVILVLRGFFGGILDYWLQTEQPRWTNLSLSIASKGYSMLGHLGN